eukprot:TRINITY_DN3139_c0_g1_i1.p1 TRINITY_DN3139_c0_g1~~TRINITY_DN3139_c0_g1_i1.p1  ORF type:complete len:894 (-),score=219.89 TRINITY_DN3139_c0_g1_i1:76-2385(-)
MWGLPEGYEYTTFGQGYEGRNSDALLTDAASGTAQTPSFIISGPTRVTYEIGVGIRKIVTVGAIQGFVWADANYNGLQDTTEVGEPGVVVSLLKAGKTVAQTNSDMDGIFTFSNLVPDIYQLHFDISALGSGYTFTQPFLGGAPTRDSNVDQKTGLSNEFQVKAGFTVTEIDAGVVPSPGTLSGYFWLDQNHDGIQNADEHGLAGLQVGILTSSGKLQTTVTTDANGAFTLVTDSVSYTVLAEFDPEFHSPTLRYVGSDPTVWSEIDSTGRTNLLTVLPGKVTSMRGGLIPLLSTIEFLVFNDLNENGLYEQFLGDGIFEGHNVSLLNSSGLPVSTKLTDGLGIAHFVNIRNGTYSLSTKLPGGQWGFVAPQASNDPKSTVDSDIIDVENSTGYTSEITIGTGELIRNLGAGIARLYSSISGYVFIDYNRNGIKDATDVPAVGFIINLLTSDGTFSTLTTATGDYTFTKLDPGTYGLQIDPISLQNYNMTKTNASPDESLIDSDFPTSGPLTINLGSNQKYCCADAGVQAISVLPSSVDGFIWDDYVARSGIQTGADTPISKISVLLRDPAGNTIQSSTSNSQGLFSFTNIFPGTYELVAVISAYTLSPYKAGNDRSRDSDFTSFGTTGFISITEGQHITDLDLGLIPKDGVVSGRAWFDSNRDGINSGETALAGVAVTLYPVTNGLRGSPLRTLTTSTSGTYSFSGVRPQSYQVYFDKPSTAWTFSPKKATTDTRTDSDVNPDTGFTDTFTVGPQQTVSNIDAGFYIA